MGQVKNYAGTCVVGCEPQEDDPIGGVCGALGGVLKSYPNQDCAEAATATCLYEGACSYEIPVTDVFKENVCKTTHQEYAPVCATFEESPEAGQATDTVTKTLPNSCHAGCKLSTTIKEGMCGDVPECSNANFATEDSCVDAGHKWIVVYDCQTNCASAPPTPHCSSTDCVLYPNFCIPSKCVGIPVEKLFKNECPDECDAPPGG
jgi:hypothetical protein